MNDGLRNRIDNALTVTFHADMTSAEQTDYVTAAVRAWLALPPSEDEIAAGVEFLRCSFPTGVLSENGVLGVLLASRAVLVRPPEGEKEPS